MTPDEMGDAEAGAALTIRVAGVRGSIPATGPETAGFGGNTPSVLVRTATGHPIILDAGTGIRSLGRTLAARGEPVAGDLFLTHFHWDHIQGLPFFPPLLCADTTLRLHAPRQGSLDARLLLGGMASPAYFPLPLQRLGAHIDFRDVGDEPWSGDGFTVSSIRVHHPAHTRGYRIDADGASVAYIPDNELTGGEADAEILDFVRGADLLIHDAMFTEAEYAQRAGWGHSSCERALALACAARTPLLLLFHHDPDRTDAELARMVDGLGLTGCDGVRVEAAAEGDEIRIWANAGPVITRTAPAGFAAHPRPGEPTGDQARPRG